MKQWSLGELCEKALVLQFEFGAVETLEVSPSGSIRGDGKFLLYVTMLEIWVAKIGL